MLAHLNNSRNEYRDKKKLKRKNTTFLSTSTLIRMQHFIADAFNNAKEYFWRTSQTGFFGHSFK